MLISRFRVCGASVGMQRRQYQMAGLGGLDGDLGGFQIADLADHDDVRILAQEGAQRLAKVRPALGLTLTWLTPGRLISAGSSAVEMLTSSDCSECSAPNTATRSCRCRSGR
jgi:hypothetical protein